MCAWYKGIEIPDNDEERVASVQTYGILDTDPEVEFDDITELAAKITGCRVSYIGFFDDKRLWLKSKYGLPPTLTERPRELTLCSPTICQSDLVVVADMSRHPRYSDLPSVKNPPNARFYCAMPLINAEGYALGTLCVWDPEPKELEPGAQQCMRQLARQVLARLNFRRRILEIEKSKAELISALEVERASRLRCESLVRSAFPNAVADLVLENKEVPPQFFASVSVLFVDFENFTQAAESLEPRILIEQLDSYFSSFDRIVRHHRLEKVKTVGDAYMCVAGLPATSNTHAVDTCSAALEIKEFMDKINADRRRLSLQEWPVRIGIHSGSVIAGLIGEERVSFDIWGDGVNVAKRMQEKCRPGSINISEATFAHVADRFATEERGAVEAKNKGLIKMYYLLGLLPR